jgi:hypothetical protein
MNDLRFRSEQVSTITPSKSRYLFGLFTPEAIIPLQFHAKLDNSFLSTTWVVQIGYSHIIEFYPNQNIPVSHYHYSTNIIELFQFFAS